MPTNDSAGAARALETIRTECHECDGTGLTFQDNEPGAAALICRLCDGSGYDDISIFRFHKRRVLPGVKYVYWYALEDGGSCRKTISVGQFQAGVREPCHTDLDWGPAAAQGEAMTKKRIAEMKERIRKLEEKTSV